MSPFSKLSALLVVATAATAGCIQPPPSPPTLTVTSPERSTVQSTAGQIQVTGTAAASDDGSPVTSVAVNGTPATVAADGSFSAMVDVPAGVTLLETIATTAEGGRATDARAVQAGALSPVNSTIPRAVTATLSADAFAKISATAGPLLAQLDLPTLLASQQPMVNLGDDLANMKLSITKMSLGNATISLTPTDGGLQFAATVDAIDVTAKADYAGSLVPDGSTSVRVTADSVTVMGTLQVTPNGSAGFTTTIASPVVTPTNMAIKASGGLVGDLVNLLTGNLGSTIQGFAVGALQTEMTPLVNDAFGALAGPQQFMVLGHEVDVAASPSAVTFTPAGAVLTLDLTANIAGGEASPGYVATTDGAPTMDVGKNSLQLAIADDLVNQMLAEVHQLGLLDIQLQGDYGLFDAGQLNMTLPPMVDANTQDGSMKLVIGDMIANFTSGGKPVLSAALNATVDVQVAPGADGTSMAFQFGKVDVVVNFLDDPTNGLGGPDVSAAVNAGIALQLDSVTQFLVTVPIPSVEGLSFDNLSLHGDSGYVVIAGDVH
jgi:hypothetical protein|nr:hypothetical protein [Kofleriaceae bacterium]